MLCLCCSLEVLKWTYLTGLLSNSKDASKTRRSPPKHPDRFQPPRTHLQDTVISTLVAGMLPLMGSKSRTVAVASTLSISSPSMRAGDPGELPELRESLETRRVDGGETERSSRASRYGPGTPPKCCPLDGKQHGKLMVGCGEAGD